MNVSSEAFNTIFSIAMYSNHALRQVVFDVLDGSAACTGKRVCDHIAGCAEWDFAAHDIDVHVIDEGLSYLQAEKGLRALQAIYRRTGYEVLRRSAKDVAYGGTL